MVENNKQLPRHSIGLESVWSTAKSKQETIWQRFLRYLETALVSIKLQATIPVITIFVVGILESIIGIILWGGNAIQNGLVQHEESVPVSVYFKDGVTSEQEQILNFLRSKSAISKIEIIDKNQALKDFSQTLGELSGLIDNLENKNPLPDGINFWLIANEKLTEQLFLIEAELRKFNSVEAVIFPEALAGSLAQLVSAAKWGIRLVLISVAVAAMFIISSTIKLAIYSRKDEIMIQQLVGVPDSNIMAPFLIEGAFQGLIGSLVALLIIVVFKYSLGEIFSSHPLFTDITLPEISSKIPLVLLAIGVTIGMIGSLAAVRGWLRTFRETI